MKKTTKAIVAVTAAAALSLSATPAFASPWGGGQIDFTVPADGYWDISNSGGLDFGGIYPVFWQNGGNNDTFDEGLGVYDETENWNLSCATADLSSATDGSGDQILLCDPETGIDLGGSGVLDVTAEYRFYADNQTVRLLLTISNPSGTAVTGATIEVFNNWYQDGYTNLEYTPTLGSMVANWPAGNAVAGDVLTVDDNIMAVDCPTGTTGNQCDPSYTPASVYQVYSTDASVKSNFGTYSPIGGDAANDNAEDQQGFLYDLPEIPGGGSVQIVNMVRMYAFEDGINDAATGDNALVATNAAIAFAQSGGWNGDAAAVTQLTAGIADFSKVVNFTAPTPSPELPNTGANTQSALGAGIGALALAIAGLVFVAIRRRSNA